MGGGGGGGQGRSSTTSHSESLAPQFIQPFLKSGIEQLVANFKANPNAPAYFPGATVAPQSQFTQQAIQQLGQRGLAGSPVTAAAGANLRDTLNGKYLDPTSNPQFQAALEASLRPQRDAFLGEVIPGITSAFVGSGRTASGAHQGVVDRAVTSFNRDQADASAKAGADYFTQARQHQLAAAGLAPEIANADYTDLAAAGQAGAATDAYKQAQINEQIARYNYGNNAQKEYISDHLNRLLAGFPGGATYGGSNTTTVTPQAGGGFGGILGNLLSGLGLGLQAYSIFSDERLKEDVEPVGKLNDGQTIYSYRYKGDPTPRIGLMAQEVAEHAPEAVSIHPSGFLAVDYDAATKRARGLL